MRKWMQVLSMGMIGYTARITAVWGFVLATALPVAAAEEAAPWRSTYDTVMMWVNFVILVALLIKVLRRPLRQFFSDQADEVVREVDKMNLQKEAAQQVLEETRVNIEQQARKLERIQDLILEQGEREKQKLIDDARNQARMMLINARQRAENRIREEGQVLKNEMIDRAFAIARQKLPARVQPSDEKQWLSRAIQALEDV